MDSILFLALASQFLLATFAVAKELKVLILLPSTDDPFWKFPFGTEMSGAAALIAIDEINNQSRPVLPGHTVVAEFVNTRCKPVAGLGVAAAALNTKDFSVVIGPPCSTVCRHVARLLAFKNLPCFNGVCQGIEMLDKKEFKTLTRLLGTFDLVGMAVSGFAKYHNWSRISIIAQKHADPIWTLTRDGVELLAVDNNITVASKLTLNEDSNDLREILKLSINRSRIIVVAVRGEVFRELMLLALELGLISGDYVFICVNFYTQKRVYGDFSWYRSDVHDEKALEAYRGVIWVNYFEPATAEYRDFKEKVKTRAKREFGFEFGPTEQVPYQASNLYEAIWMYAIAMNETLATGGDTSNGTLISQRLWGRDFGGITGTISLNSNGDREQGYTILQTRANGASELMGHFFSKKQVFDPKPGQEYIWAAGRTSTPSDSPRCGWKGELCEEQKSNDLLELIVSLVSVMAVLIAIGAAVIWAIYRRLKWQKDVAEMNWRINYDDIVFSKHATSAFSRLSVGTNCSSIGPLGKRRLIHGTLHGVPVFIKKMDASKSANCIWMVLKEELKQLYDLNHDNLVRFVGACFDHPRSCVVLQYCSKGSLEDALSNDDINLDRLFKFSLMQDILKGLLFLRTTFVKYHGNLKTANCLLGSRFEVRLSDFALETIRTEKIMAKDRLWKAPECLRSPSAVYDKEAADVYSFGIIMQEIVMRMGPFYTNQDLSPEEIITRVKGGNHPLLRPLLTERDFSGSMVSIIKECWDEIPSCRPTLGFIHEVFSAVAPSLGMKSGTNIMDNLLQRMETYANNLEALVEERTSQYLDEKQRVEDLLHRLLPRSIAQQLQATGQVIPEAYTCVTVYFSDIVGFTSLSAESSPLQIVDFLNKLYTVFDEIVDSYNVYKVETIGDAYMVVSGLPTVIPSHAEEIAQMSLSLLEAVKVFEIPHRPAQMMEIRVGVHSGPVVAGVVGHKMPRYCLFGDTVNTASRMESSSQANRIQLSPATAAILSEVEGYHVISRGEIQVKGKGVMETAWLLGYKSDKVTEKSLSSHV